eukprot:6197206-Pleurochrysis_carterae.AAC.1
MPMHNGTDGDADRLDMVMRRRNRGAQPQACKGQGRRANCGQQKSTGAWAWDMGMTRLRLRPWMHRTARTVMVNWFQATARGIVASAAVKKMDYSS